jgi:hypothetical protein
MRKAEEEKRRFTKQFNVVEENAKYVAEREDFVAFNERNYI